MSRYRGPKLKIVRKLQQRLPGLTTKTVKKKVVSGFYTGKRKKISQYAIRLQEKQKLRYHYGLTESQLVNYIKLARKGKGASGEILLELLEMRLDTIIFQFGMTPTICCARQLINHGHILVNNKKVTIPSYQCHIDDSISFSKRKTSQKLVSSFVKNLNSYSMPAHLNFQENLLTGKINATCTRDDVQLKLNELLVIEYYSKRL